MSDAGRADPGGPSGGESRADAPSDKRSGRRWAEGHATHSIEEAAPFAIVHGFSLSVTKGPDADKTFMSEGDRVVIGTHESSDLVLTDQTVSRFHCELSIAGGRVVVRDLESTNGTLLNGVAIVQAKPASGATLKLGHTELQFEVEPESRRLPLSPTERFGTMVGRSVVMRRVFATLGRVASTDTTVLLEGETGTGKEVAAESVHRESARREGPFVVVDCAAIPPDLLESELFGHERGAFTGATGERAGVFEMASGGTLFLDEIGELSLDLQPKLLRALESREIKRVGGNRQIGIDVRIIAATNRRLHAEVNEKKFRSDLYYRLAVVEVRLPPLRERPDDLPLLVDALLEHLDASDHPAAERIRSRPFLDELARHAWPGNIRELRNYIERCIALGETESLAPAPATSSDYQPDFTVPLKVARERWTRRFERRYVEEMLRQSDGNVAAAARAAGVDRMYFYRLLWRYGLK